MIFLRSLYQDHSQYNRVFRLMDGLTHSYLQIKMKLLKEMIVDGSWFMQMSFVHHSMAYYSFLLLL